MVNKYTIDNPMPPLWLVFPYIDSDMFPAPKTWAGYYDDESSPEQLENYVCGISLWTKNGEPEYTKRRGMP